jgi:hypothetical protein
LKQLLALVQRFNLSLGGDEIARMSSLKSAVTMAVLFVVLPLLFLGIGSPAIRFVFTIGLGPLFVGVNVANLLR